MSNNSREVLPVRVDRDVVRILEEEASASPMIDSRSEIVRKILVKFTEEIRKPDPAIQG